MSTLGRCAIASWLVLAACGSRAAPSSVDPVATTGPNTATPPPASPPPTRPPVGQASRPSPPFADAPCAADTDCVLDRHEDGCCDMCGARALTKAGMDAFRRHCEDRQLRCPAIDCPFEPRRAACVDGRCVTVPEQPAASAPACRPATADERAAVAEAERVLAAAGVLRGSPAPPAPPSPPPAKTKSGRTIRLEEIDVSRESLEAHAWGVARSGPAGQTLVVFRYDRDWLGRTFPAAQADAEHERVGQVVIVEPGPRATERVHQDFLLDHVDHLCP